MTGPVHMNQVLFQTPSVEKIQQAEHQNPDTTQRNAAAEEMVNFQQRTETVQTGVKTERSKELDKDGKKRDKSSRKKMSGTTDQPEQDDEQLIDSERLSGRIVDIVI